jgi:hypothetical protein
MGVVPNVFLKPMAPAVDRMVQRVGAYQQRTVQADPSPVALDRAGRVIVVPGRTAAGAR